MGRIQQRRSPTARRVASPEALRKALADGSPSNRLAACELAIDLSDAVALLKNQGPIFREQVAMRLLQTEADRAFVYPPPLPAWVTPTRHEGYAMHWMCDGEIAAYSALKPGEACGCGCTAGCTPEPGTREARGVALGIPVILRVRDGAPLVLAAPWGTPLEGNAEADASTGAHGAPR
jgi:hypothetical protein